MAHNAKEALNGMSLQGSKMADTEMQNGNMQNGHMQNDHMQNGVASQNGIHTNDIQVETNGIESNVPNPPTSKPDATLDATLAPAGVVDQKQAPDLQASSFPSEQIAGNSLIDFEQSEINEAPTAPLTPASPPLDIAGGLGEFDHIQPASRPSDFHDKTMEEMGVQEVPLSADQTIGDVDLVSQNLSQNNSTKIDTKENQLSEIPPPVVPKEAFSDEPVSPSKIPKNSKLPKMTPPASPKKKVSESIIVEDVESRSQIAPTKAKIAPVQSIPKSPKTEGVKEKEQRSQTGPSSKIPSPKKERAPVTTPKKTDGASDSGIEEDRGTPRNRTPASSEKKKYGIDSKNTSYKPSGGNVKIFDKKVDVKATPRIDAKLSPRSPGSPRTRPGGYVPPDMPQSKKLTETIKTMTPSPNTKEVTSKVGSLKNAKHTPGGGNIKIVTKKEDFSTVSSKCGSTANIKHTPGGGAKKIESQKLDWKGESRVGSLQNAKHKPKGGDKKITSHKLEWNVTSRVGSMEKADHKPGGGDKKIESRKVEWNVGSRIGSLDNASHTPRGGTKKIESHKVDFRDKAAPKVGSTKNLKHQAGGGDKKIETQKLDWNAAPKIGSMDNAKHTPGGGDKKIENHKVEFKEKAAPKIGSTANLEYQPGGGTKQIETRKLEFREKAAARTNHGLSPAKVAEAAETST